jgi:hypothetical protein
MSPNPGQKTAAEALAAAVLILLRPLVRVLLRYGVPYGAFADLAKRVYVETANEEFTIPGRKQSQSRVSVLTGLSRKEVKRVTSLPRPDDQGAVDRYNRAARVISGWTRDTEYCDANGAPTVLDVESGERNFATLVRKHSGDVPVRAILDELTRVGAIALDEDGRVHLLARAYVPQSGEADKLAILGADVSDLIACIDHNLQCPPEDAFFQRKVSYDNLPDAPAREVRDLAAKRAQRLLEELDGWMASRDRDSNPDASGEGRQRAALGIYFYEEDVDKDDIQ